MHALTARLKAVLFYAAWPKHGKGNFGDLTPSFSVTSASRVLIQNRFLRHALIAKYLLLIVDENPVPLRETRKNQISIRALHWHPRIHARVSKGSTE
jgi:hypothetical protein